MDHHDEEFLRKAGEAKARVLQVSAEEVDSKLSAGSVVVDVRESEDHKKEHIPGSINISIESIAKKASEIIPDKSTPVICYCNGGNRGSLAAVELQAAGYTNVSSVDGGLRAYVSMKNEKQ
jgi:rhodanese-related sulfurtransferase